MTIQDLPAIIGAIPILAGIGQVFIQMHRSSGPQEYRHQTAAFDKEGVKVQSAYPGMVMIAIGALLLLTGIFFGPASN